MVKDPQQAVINSITETELSDNVRQLATALNFLAYHTWRSDHSPAGFPDWVFVKDGRLIFVELKRQKGKLSPHQEEWILELIPCNSVEVYVWRPSEWLNGTVERILKDTPKEESNTIPE